MSDRELDKLRLEAIKSYAESLSSGPPGVSFTIGSRLLLLLQIGSKSQLKRIAAQTRGERSD